jgi:RNA polymerase sigma-70 factor (ECF subfamily)
MNKPIDVRGHHELHPIPMKALDPGVDAQAAETCLVALMSQYQRSLYGFLLLLVADRSLAQDCLQDTFVRAYQHLEKGAAINRQWLYKVARNLAVDELRKRRKLRLAETELNAFAAHEPQEDHRSMRVRQALAQLPTGDRELLYLSGVDGLSAESIGHILGLRPGAVRMRLCRAHKRFRAIYGDSP